MNEVANRNSTSVSAPAANPFTAYGEQAAKAMGWSFHVADGNLGIAGGYDNGIAHGSVGYYLTVAEWGRWNFGVPSIEVGMGRYPAIDRLSQRPITKEQFTVMVSLTSAHYRVGYVRAWGVNCYLNIEQVFDLHANRTGSQFGLSFSTK